jgi:cell division septal protein FtsQ
MGKPKRSQRRKRRGNSRYAIFFLLIVIAIIVSGFTATHFMKRMSFFDIEQIIVDGNENLNSSFLEELALEFVGQNLFAVASNDVRLRYDNIIRIKRMKTRRSLPNKLKLIFEERKGFVYLNTKEGVIVPVDKEMMVLDNRGFYLSEDLPVFHTDISKEELLAGDTLSNEIVAEIMNVHERIALSSIDEQLISEYYFRNGNLFIVEASTGSRICLGSESFQDKIEKLEFVWQNIGIENNTKMDFRFKNQVVISSL